MKLGICTIQRNRGRWLVEWVLFHYLVGFRCFYIYLHKCTDDSAEIVLSLSRKYNIKSFIVPDDTVRPQLVSYQHAYQEFEHEIDWMAFIDGDEFLFPTKEKNLQDVLSKYNYEKISALGVWWACFGSGGHLSEPDGLILENYIKRPPLSFSDNSHIKSIVRGRQGSSFSVGPNSHIFKTIYGTRDENMRNINSGFMPDLAPTYKELRINHYVCQSYEFFKKFKQNSGAADAGALAVRPDEWWDKHDQNDEEDLLILKFLPELKNLIDEIRVENEKY